MLKLGLVSFWHVHAKDYVAEAAANPDTEIIAAWDENPERGRAAADSIGVSFHERLEDLLAIPELDGVIVTSATMRHGEILPAAARAGKHIFTEKVIAPTLRETQEIVAEIDQSGVTCVVALRWLPSGVIRAIQAAIAAGTIGALTEVRVRVAHDGALRTPENPDGWLPARFFDPAEAAGGILIDFGAHPLYLTRLFLGMPDSLVASYGYVTERAVEDIASVTMRYANGAIGIAEATAVGRAAGISVDIFGTAGTLRWGGPGEPVLIRGTERGATETPLESIPDDDLSPFNRWVAHIQAGTVAPENVALAVDLSALAEAANQSAREDRPVRVGS